MSAFGMKSRRPTNAATTRHTKMMGPSAFPQSSEPLHELEFELEQQLESEHEPELELECTNTCAWLDPELQGSSHTRRCM
jgi:hypothetical protein